MTATFCTENLKARAARVAAVATFVITAMLWIAAVVGFTVHWGEPRANGLEIRLTGFAVLASVAARTAGGIHARIQRRRETYADYQIYGDRLGRIESRIAELERVVHEGGRNIAALDRTVTDINGRTLWLKRMLEEDAIVERPGEDTGELISVPRARTHLRSVSRPAKSNPA